MNEHTHQFSTPLARDLFTMGLEGLMGEPPDEYQFGYLHKFSNKPVTLPNCDPKQIESELQSEGRIHVNTRPQQRE